ncbi:hypothetical protein FOIG_00239 [Fusarium odoratissimum NRRL 54006]|uniref:Uncharacterized protein n=1 Tax=Fusarium odoratissimum (strain NRRL 54006) TaxID=1089451 RepID=X0K937_FUSO5|nr:uncharacterized protein FOIG_00239 [Fusarium odoratissimum NRRL 54006]EXM09963.1 hypothetical protein FOIG_00239 [Fusarium odoratissimum NRRL 54006]
MLKAPNFRDSAPELIPFERYEPLDPGLSVSAVTIEANQDEPLTTEPLRDSSERIPVSPSEGCEANKVRESSSKKRAKRTSRDVCGLRMTTLNCPFGTGLVPKSP